MIEKTIAGSFQYQDVPYMFLDDQQHWTFKQALINTYTHKIPLMKQHEHVVFDMTVTGCHGQVKGLNNDLHVRKLLLLVTTLATGNTASYCL